MKDSGTKISLISIRSCRAIYRWTYLGLMLGLCFSMLPAYSQPSIYMERVKESVKPGFSFGAAPVATYKGEVYFAGRSADSGEELWKTDGTPKGTHMIKDLRPGIRGSGIQNLTSGPDGVYFIADPPTFGQKVLWKTNGTAATTKVVDSTVAPSSPLIPFDGGIYFSAGPDWYKYKNGTLTLQPGRGSFASGSCVLADNTRLFLSGSTLNGESAPLMFDGKTSELLGNFGDDIFFKGFLASTDQFCYAKVDDFTNSNQPEKRVIRISASGEITLLPADFGFFRDQTVVASPTAIYFKSDGPDGSAIYQVSDTSNTPTKIRGTSPNFLNRLYWLKGKLWFSNGENVFAFNPATGVLKNVLTNPDLTTIDIIEFEDELLLFSVGISGHWVIQRSDGITVTSEPIFSREGPWLGFTNAPIFRFAANAIDKQTSHSRLLFIGNSGFGNSLFSLSKTPRLTDHLSGDWVNPNIKDQGLLLFNSESESEKFIFAAWFTYSEGKPVWYAGNATYAGGESQITIPMIALEGLDFVNKDPAMFADRETIGEIVLIPEGCKELTIQYSIANQGSGTEALIPLFLTNPDPRCAE